MIAIEQAWTGLGLRQQIALAVLTLAAALLIGLTIAGIDVHPMHAVMVLMLFTLLLAAQFGLKVSLASAVISDAILVFFFFEPIFVFWADDSSLRLTLALFLFCAAVAGTVFQDRRSLLGQVPANTGLRFATSEPTTVTEARRERPVLTIDSEARVVRLGDEVVQLTPTEYNLLQYLYVNAGRLLPHHTILAEVWGTEYGADTQILRTYVKQLRAKLGDDPASPSFIRTENRLGYRFTLRD